MRLVFGSFLERWQYYQQGHLIGFCRKYSARYLTLAHFRLRGSRRRSDEYIALDTFSSLPLCSTYSVLMYYLSALTWRSMCAWCTAWESSLSTQYQTFSHVRPVYREFGARVPNSRLKLSVYIDKSIAHVDVYTCELIMYRAGQWRRAASSSRLLAGQG